MAYRKSFSTPFPVFIVLRGCVWGMQGQIFSKGTRFKQNGPITYIFVGEAVGKVSRNNREVAVLEIFGKFVNEKTLKILGRKNQPDQKIYSKKPFESPRQIFPN